YEPKTVEGVVVGEGPATRTHVSLQRMDGLAPVPDLIGLTEDEAVARIEDAGFTVGEINRVLDDSVPQWEVFGQSPAADTNLPPGSPIGVTVSLGAPGLLAILLYAPDGVTPVDGAVLTINPPLFSLGNVSE